MAARRFRFGAGSMAAAAVVAGSLGFAGGTWLAERRSADRARFQGCPEKLRPSAERIMKYGFPSRDNLKFRNAFVLDYDRRTRNARWVAECLTPEEDKSKPIADRRRSNFHADASEPEPFRVRPDDYTHSGSCAVLCLLTCFPRRRLSDVGMSLRFLPASLC